MHFPQAFPFHFNDTDSCLLPKEAIKDILYAQRDVCLNFVVTDAHPLNYKAKNKAYSKFTFPS